MTMKYIILLVCLAAQLAFASDDFKPPAVIKFIGLRNDFGNHTLARDQFASNLAKITGGNVVVDTFDSTQAVWHDPSIVDCSEAKVNDLMSKLILPDQSLTRNFKMQLGELFTYPKVSVEWLGPCENIGRKRQGPQQPSPTTTTEAYLSEAPTTPATETVPTSTPEPPTTPLAELASTSSSPSDDTTTSNSSGGFSLFDADFFKDFATQAAAPTTTPTSQVTPSTESIPIESTVMSASESVSPEPAVTSTTESVPPEPATTPYYGKYVGLVTAFVILLAYLGCAQAYRRQGMYEL